MVGPEELGGIGDIGAKAELVAKANGLPVEEAYIEVRLWNSEFGGI